VACRYRARSRVRKYDNRWVICTGPHTCKRAGGGKGKREKGFMGKPGFYMHTRLGYPPFFVTFTANPKWPEIIEAIRETSPMATSSDAADIIARVFKLKLDDLMHDLIYKQIFGRLAGISMVIEYQKRNLPHAHIVVIIHPEDRHKKA
jgi:hypothetical protein